MPNLIKTSESSVSIAVLLFDGFSNHCLANLIEPFRAANTISGRSLYRWRFLTPDGAAVRSSSGLPVNAEMALGQHSGDMLFVMPSYGFREFARPMAAPLRRASTRFDVIAGLDTGSWLMAAAALLEARSATIHWDEIDAFRDAFPNVGVVKERYIIDAGRITCSGAAATFDLVLKLIERAHGSGLALDVAQIFMTQRGASFGAYEGTRQARQLQPVIDEMQKTLETPLPIPTLARRLGCSQRQLESRVAAELGISPQKLYQRLRLSQARRLVQETELSIADIAVQCGYDNPSAMTRAFRLEFGHAPRLLRQHSKRS